MSDYYFDEDHGIAYKIDPVLTSVVHASGNSSPGQILVRTDVKVTNLRKEKIRRTISEMYPSDKYDHEAARNVFTETLLKFITGARKISEKEYEHIKYRYEM